MRNVAPSGKVPVCVVTAPTALGAKESSRSVRAETENARFVMRHIKKTPLLNTEFFLTSKAAIVCPFRVPAILLVLA